MALTEAEQRELDELELEELQAEEAMALKPAAPPPPAQEETPAWRQLLSGLSTVLDYPGGIARTGLAGAANIPKFLATGESAVGPEDVQAAFRGEAPTSAEYMKRLGVGEGDVVDYPVAGNVSTRDLAGFGLDVATDPLTALSKAGKFGMNYLDVAAKKGGKKLYQSGLKNIDEKVAESGAGKLSDLMMKQGSSGTTKQIQKDAEKLLDTTLAERKALYSQADGAGALVDPRKAFGDVLDEAIEMGKRDPGLKELSEKLQEKIAGYVEFGPVPVSQASEWKTNLYNSMPDAAFNQFGKLKDPAKKIEKKMTKGLRREILASGESVAPGLGQAIDKSNETMQTLLTARKPMQKQVKSAKNKNAVTSVDAILAGTGAAVTHDPFQTAAILAAKKAADLSKTTYFRTKAGKRLSDMGESNMLTPIAGRAIMQSPWVKMKDQEK
jgi:hypothetical protein